MAFSQLLLALQRLVEQLTLSGRTQSARFFQQHHDLLTAVSQSDHRTAPVLHQLAGCRAMAQYADFSFVEEKLLDEVVDSACLLKETLTPP